MLKIKWQKMEGGAAILIYILIRFGTKNRQDKNELCD